jgi:hypothetical protein
MEDYKIEDFKIECRYVGMEDYKIEDFKIGRLKMEDWSPDYSGSVNNLAQKF